MIGVFGDSIAFPMRTELWGSSQPIRLENFAGLGYECRYTAYRFIEKGCAYYVTVGDRVGHQ